MTAFSSAIYVGHVTHTRSRPRRHSLRYRLYGLLIDLDELPSLARKSRWFSYNSSNIFSLRDADFGDRSRTPIVEQVRALLRAADLPADGAITLLAMPRVLGHIFNPLSVFFCHDASGALAAILYEVHNTFGERHCYLMRVERDSGDRLRQFCVKDFHVSPFMDMGLAYRFEVSPPHDEYRLSIVASDQDGPLLVANQFASRVEWSDSALAKVFVSHPLVTLKVITAIHWEALRLWIKGVALRSKPPAPDQFVTADGPLVKH